jgi:hypothetical protein
MKIKNISFERSRLFTNLGKQTRFYRSEICYLFPQRIDVWNQPYKESTTYAFLWFRLTFYYRISAHTHKYIYTVPMPNGWSSFNTEKPLNGLRYHFSQNNQFFNGIWSDELNGFLLDGCDDKYISRTCDYFTPATN